MSKIEEAYNYSVQLWCSNLLSANSFQLIHQHGFFRFQTVDPQPLSLMFVDKVGILHAFQSPSTILEFRELQWRKFTFLPLFRWVIFTNKLAVRRYLGQGTVTPFYCIWCSINEIVGNDYNFSSLISNKGKLIFGTRDSISGKISNFEQRKFNIKQESFN